MADLQLLKGVGPKQAELFAKLGLTTTQDLVQHWPRKYIDYSKIVPIGSLEPGLVTFVGSIQKVSGRYVRRGMHITEAVVADETGSTRLTWFNQPYRAASLTRDRPYYISGEYKLAAGRFSLQNPVLEMLSEDSVNTARIVPIYKETSGLTSKQIRAAMTQALQQLAHYETLPAWLVKQYGLTEYTKAVKSMHFPEGEADLAQARHRLGFEEVFGLSLASGYLRKQQRLQPAIKVPFQSDIAQKFARSLPFTLTDAQKSVMWQIGKDMQLSQPMNRLVEGDVGAGKTVVATMAILMAVMQDLQVAVMAPTEILARQHASTIATLLKAVDLDNKVGLLVGGLRTPQKRAARQAILSGDMGVIVGTQALIQDSVDMHKLALVVIDEQHRFGVEQRKTLQKKAGHMPHVLSMTATPIPRTLALTLYGELDVSVITQKPIGRLPIKTNLVPPSDQPKMYAEVITQLEQGRQAFVVCPLIADSGAVDAVSAESLHKKLSTSTLKEWRVGLLHGRLSAEEKQSIMQDFSDHKLDVLVATSVIEVGVDVPNASILIVASPERFGLAQLHQLRGRVGRGNDQAYCYALLKDAAKPSRRLQAFASSHDGFKLSELDLRLRGPGAIYGTLQHGALDLRIAQLHDRELVAAAQAAAREFIDQDEDLLQYKQLAATVARLQTVTKLN